MKEIVVGRTSEKAILEKALQSQEAEMISVIGRRRVGKTYLIRTVYSEQIVFEISGLQDATGKEQLRNFANQLRKFSGAKTIIPPPKDWLDAFFILIDFLEQLETPKKPVVFFDEVPWMATHKSGFLKGLSYFWNSWAVKQNIVVVICGSAASWMIQKILRNTGGLHNRVTRRIRLKPFTLAETEQYLAHRGIHLERYQLLQLYMAMGGIPHYLKEIEGGTSATQNIDRICFSENGLLRDEFLSLYPALFKQAEYHTIIIRTLAAKPNGLTRSDLIQAAKLSESGRITRVLIELEESGFITAYTAFGKKKKGKLYRLTDEYSIFYLRFIKPNLTETQGVWQSLSRGQAYKIWCGYAFENVCLKHADQIKKALGIAGMYTRISSFHKKGDDQNQGTQIDLLIDRDDRTINIIEIKFYDGVFTISKAYAQKLRDKKQIFRETTQTKKQIFLTLITAFGLKSNINSIGLVDSQFASDILFEKSQ
ncbi:MAG: ATP-binding protein [Saprospiraceae bacterium]